MWQDSPSIKDDNGVDLWDEMDVNYFLESYESNSQDNMSLEMISVPETAPLETSDRILQPEKAIHLTRELFAERIALGKPILRNDGMLCVGTEGTTTDSQLIIGNFHLQHDGSAGSRRSIALERPILDMQWLTPTSSVVAFGNGLRILELPLLYLNHNLNSCRLNPNGPDPHTDTIREIATCFPFHLNIVSGGFDKTVRLTTATETGDILPPTANHGIQVDNVVGSIRWHKQSPTQFSWTEDDGLIKLYDARADKIALNVNVGLSLPRRMTGRLFTHDTIGDGNAILLGYEKGHLAAVDLRRPSKLICSLLASDVVSTVGDIRRLNDAVSIFGIGGFCLCTLHHEESSFGCNIIGKMRKDTSQEFKANGDSILHDNSLLGVSTSNGDVEFYRYLK